MSNEMILEAREGDLRKATKQDPAVFPAKLLKVVENNNADFLGMVTGDPKSALFFEINLFNIADKISKDYSGGNWEFAEVEGCEKNKTLIMHTGEPKQPYFCEWNGNYAEGWLSGELFGVVASLFTLNAMAWGTDGKQRDRFIDLYHSTSRAIHDGLYNLAKTSLCPREIVDARLAQRMIYKFLD